MTVASVTTIRAHGVLDHARAEALAARLRAAVRNGIGAVTVDFDPGTVIASGCLLAFMLRASAVMRGRGGALKFSGDEKVLDQLRALGILAATAPRPEVGPGDEP